MSSTTPVVSLTGVEGVQDRAGVLEPVVDLGRIPRR
jgi:hypothetical protein